MQSIIIGANQAGQRLDKFLHKYLPEAGSSFLYKMLRKKNITLNGRKAEGKEMLAMGDEVKFFFSQETFAKFAGNSPYEEYELAYKRLKGIEILYEDADFILLNKPPGILTQKADAQEPSLNEWLIGCLLAHDKQIRADLASFRPSVCNRLDRNTSGIVLCGKSLSGSQTLSRIIREHTLRKYYYTVCIGEISAPRTIEGRLSKECTLNRVSVDNSSPDADCEESGGEGSFIKTAYRPLTAAKGYTLLEVELITGKTHQIRAHLASIGHPIIGDFKYGDKKRNRRLQEEYNLQHQLLHAHHAVFPKDAGALGGRTLRAPCPAQFETICRALGLSGEPDNYGSKKHCEDRYRWQHGIQGGLEDLP